MKVEKMPAEPEQLTVDGEIANVFCFEKCWEIQGEN